MRLRPALCLLLLATVILTGCFRQRVSGDDVELPRIEVRNRFFGPVVTYLIANGSSIRLGMVQSNRTVRFDFPVGVNPYASDIRLLADPIGEFESYTSESIIVSGRIIQFTIENELRFSTVIVR